MVANMQYDTRENAYHTSFSSLILLVLFGKGFVSVPSWALLVTCLGTMAGLLILVVGMLGRQRCLFLLLVETALFTRKRVSMSSAALWSSF